MISDLNAGGLIHATLDGGGTMGTLLFLPGIFALDTFTFTRTNVNDEPWLLMMTIRVVVHRLLIPSWRPIHSVAFLLCDATSSFAES